MTRNTAHLEQALHSVSEETFSSEDHQQRLKAQLLEQHSVATSPTFYRRHQVTLVLLCALFIVGGGIAATRAMMRVLLYDIAIESNGEVISNPRILVNEGQAAQMTITDEDGTIHIVNIDESGNVTYQGNDDSAALEVEVSEPSIAATTIEAVPAETNPGELEAAHSVPQLLYHIELKRGGEVIAMPRVLVLQGKIAKVTISDAAGMEHITTIHEDGSVTYVGDSAVTVEYRIESVSEHPATGDDDH